MYCRCNPDENLRKLERDYDGSPTPQNLARFNVARRQAGLPLILGAPVAGSLLKRRQGSFGKAWQAQSVLTDGLTLSSAGVVHDGWWGISHATWVRDGPMVMVGYHFVRSFRNDHGSPRPIDIVRAKPTDKELLIAHQQVKDRIYMDGVEAISGEYQWDWPNGLSELPG